MLLAACVIIILAAAQRGAITDKCVEGFLGAGDEPAPLAGKSRALLSDTHVYVAATAQRLCMLHKCKPLHHPPSSPRCLRSGCAACWSS